MFRKNKALREKILREQNTITESDRNNDAKTYGLEIVTTDRFVFTEEEEDDDDAENEARRTSCFCIQKRSPEDPAYRFLQVFAPICWMTQRLIHEFIIAIFTAGANANLNFIRIILHVYIYIYTYITPNSSHVVLYVSGKENLYDVISCIYSHFRKA